ncbi:uncharacterized protein BDR25DRAFT_236361, partial [Lindgomyces ingoldianus]
AMKLGLGVPMLMFAPAIKTWGAPFTVYYLFLQKGVVFQRLESKANSSFSYMGDTTNYANSTADLLFVANRYQVNFIENVPIAVLVLLLDELNGADRHVSSNAIGAHLAFRVSYVEIEMNMKDRIGLGRPLGYYGTLATTARGFLQISADAVRNMGK